jgi:ATP-dependent exoDNAse (exonuclease V) beta subunit
VGDTEIKTVLTLKSHHDLVYRRFAMVCTELKLLYVAITRPKNFLIIYDDDAEVRKPMQEYWLKSNVVDYIDRKMAVR